MKVQYKFLIIFLVAFAITIVPNLFLFHSGVIDWLPMYLWYYLSILRFILLIGLFLLAIHFWIIKPLKQITQALSFDDPRFVEELAQSPDEFGKIGILLQQFFAQQKEKEVETSTMVSRQKELIQLKSHFITLVSHEFRTPISAISSNVQLLNKYGERWPVEKKTIVLRRIQEAIKKMIILLEEVTLISQDQSGSLSIHPEVIQINNFVNDVIEDLRKSSELPVHLELNIEQGEDDIYCDKELLRQILSHLLSNAGKFNPQEMPVGVTVTRDNDHIKMVVSDHGIGIPERELDRLFQPFHRCSNSEGYPGTGLGMSIVKRCVDLLKGSIRVTSQVNVGTTIEVRVPLRTTKATDYEQDSDY
ncbi:sensor histidine kinase [Bacteroidota bacterium]